MKVKTIDINARTWFDKVNGNSYFSAIVVIDFSMPTVQEFTLPFQYGYGSQYIDEAKQLLIDKGLITNNGIAGLYSYCKDNNIILRTNNQTGCLKRDVINFVK